MTAFNFVDHDPRPTQYTRNPTLIREFAAALVARPGEWAEFPVPSTTRAAARMLAHRIKGDHSGCPEALLGNRFDATARDGIVYVRYNQETRP